MSFRYSDELLRRFRNPKNAGKIENADGVGVVGNRTCGDIMHLYLRVKNNIIVEIKFETLGCAAAIAFSDLLCDTVKNKSIDKALSITKDSLIRELGDVPPIKLHCSLLALDALHRAIEDFKKKK